MIDFAQLRRWPDIEAPELVAHDATDRLLLDTAAEVAADVLTGHPGDVVVVGDSQARRIFRDALQVAPAVLTPLVYLLSR